MNASNEDKHKYTCSNILYHKGLVFLHGNHTDLLATIQLLVYSLTGNIIYT